MASKNVDVKEITVKSALVKSNIPGIDFVINPYIGCRFACTYCYASFMGRFVGKTVEEWGSYVFIKKNIPLLLEKELSSKNFSDKGVGKEVFLSSVTDPYQGMEAKYRLTRKCLDLFVKFDIQAAISILTKSDLVTRDIDLFKKLNNVFVGLTVTSTNDDISRYFETYAPPVTNRLKALETLNKQGIATYAFIGPILPHFVAREEELDKLMKKLCDIGTHDMFVEHINLSPYIRKRFLREVTEADKSLVSTYYKSQSKKYRNELDKIIKELIKKHNMNLLHDSVIFHKEYRKKGRDKKINSLVKNQSTS